VAQTVGTGIALLFHDRGTRRGWVVSSTPRPHFTPGKDPVLILQEAGWVPGPVWTGGKSRPHRDSIPDRLARSKSLYRMSYLAHYIYIYTHIPNSCTVSPSSNKVLDIRDIESRSRNQYYHGKAHSGCVFVAIGVQRAMRMRCVVLASVTCLPLQYFSTLYQTARHLKCVFWFFFKFCLKYLSF